MGAVTLTISKPANDQNFIGTRKVAFEGSPTAPPVALFYRWYSNNWPAHPIKVPLGTSLKFEADLPVGSHAIILSAKNVAGDSKDNLPEVLHAGMTGGPPGIVPTPCLIHVLVADMKTTAATLSKAGSLLVAEAPPQWDNADYQKTSNQLRYRWIFSPSGLLAGQAPVDFMPALKFDNTGNVPVVKYQGALPDVLDLGDYVLTLRVERSDNTAIKHEVSRIVKLKA